jgi:hypothetical protein
LAIFATNGSISVHCWVWGERLRIALLLLKPLAWIFGKKGRHDAYGYVCFGNGGGIGVGHPGAAVVAKENVLCAKTAMLC